MAIKLNVKAPNVVRRNHQVCQKNGETTKPSAAPASFQTPALLHAFTTNRHLPAESREYSARREVPVSTQSSLNPSNLHPKVAVTAAQRAWRVLVIRLQAGKSLAPAIYNASHMLRLIFRYIEQVLDTGLKYATVSSQPEPAPIICSHLRNVIIVQTLF